MNKGLLDIYSDYLISQNHHATATGLSSMLKGEISPDQVSRFLRAEALWVERVMGLCQTGDSSA